MMIKNFSTNKKQHILACTNSKITHQLQKEKRVEEYLINPNFCTYCKNLLFYDKRKNKFCNKSCANSYNNSLRILSEETKQKISIGVKATGKRPPKPKTKPLLKLTCKICKLSFNHKNLKQTCSEKCRRKLSSKIATERILKLGTSNLSTKILNFNYKGLVINCDSKLEAAAVIYLKEKFNISSISRFRNVLNYETESGYKQFNPDFITCINSKITIIEVKQVWTESKNKNRYTQYLKEKELALKEFCLKKNYEYIWLDFNYDKKFKTIYNKFLKVAPGAGFEPACTL